MAQVITTGAHPKALWPGILQWWGREYKKHPEVWKQLFEIVSSNKAYEEDVELTGFGLVPVKPEGDGIKYDSEQQGYVTRYTNVTYGMGYIVTEEAIEDSQYTEVSKRRSSALAFSAQTTKETVHANIFNRAFNASFTGGDGVSMINAAHPTLDGTQSNALTVAADLSEASLEDLCIQIMNAKNIVGTLFRGGLVCWTFLTDPDAFFVTTNVPAGLKHLRRKAGVFAQDNDFDTSNAKSKFVERYSAGWTDWRTVFGSPGS